MSTRHATPGSEFAPEKFASSPEFERGLPGAMVARRCSALDDPKGRELIWFLHWLSHQPGAWHSLVGGLLANYPEKIGTPSMLKIGKRAGQKYNAAEVREIRRELPENIAYKFPLRGETDCDRDHFHRQSMEARRIDAFHEGYLQDWEQEMAKEKAEAAKRPAAYAVNDFLAVCRKANDAHDWENELRRLCLDPAFKLQDSSPWHFAGMVEALRDYFAQWVERRGEGLVVTSVGKRIEEAMEIARTSRRIGLCEGLARTGKTFAAKAWCELHPGCARFIECPPGIDETSFFRALARGLGIGNFSQYKAIEIRERVESVLLSGDLLICLDEAWRLWHTQTERRRFVVSKRVEWVRYMSDQGVHFLLLSTPQFLAELKAKEGTAKFNTAQLQGRLRYHALPNELSFQELVDVAAVHLPEANSKTLRAVADYARTSARYLSAVETIAEDARRIASNAGRDCATEDDVRRAMEDGVIPSDTNLVRALNSKPEPAGRQRRLAAALPLAGSRAASSETLLNGTGTRSAGIEITETENTL